MSDPVWIAIATVLAIHDAQIAQHGGSPEVRDMGLLESALARPLNLFHYEDYDTVALAGAYAFGIARNHPFVDGNKRVSAVVTETFLAMNGVDLIASDEAMVRTWLALAAGEMTENDLVAWLRDNTR